MKKRIILVLGVVCAPLTLIALAQTAPQPPGQKAAPAPSPQKSPAAPAASPAQPKAAPAAPTADAGPASGADRAADEAAIKAAEAAFRAAYNARDAKKLAALWSSEAVYVDPATGEQIVGRDAIQKEFEEAFADKQDVKLTADVESIEFVSPNVAVIRGVAHVTRPGEAPDDSEFTIVRVKQNGQWLIDRVSEVEKEKPPPSNYEHLKQLEWMIGSWHDDDPRPNVEIQTDCQWTKNKNFMTRSFAFAIGDQVKKSGMQVIGWDAANKEIRSWVFDSDGGFAEGTWKRKGDRWFIENTATLPDGGKASATNIMTKLDDNSFKWESVNREVDSQLVPNVEPVLVVRKAD
jgi:uncharacterized protein (TIGR02246 family)